MKSVKLFSSLFLLALFSSISGGVWGQVANGVLDFGTIANGTIASSANTGFGGVRVGSGGGGFTIVNPGQQIGTGSELRGTAPTNLSVNSVGITSTEYGSSAKTFTISFELHLSGASIGSWYFFAGNGTSFSSAQSSGFTGSHVFTGIRWSFENSGSISTSNREVSTWNSSGLSTPFTQDNGYIVTIVGNNSPSTVNYGFSNAYTVAANKYDLWVNGILVGDDLAKAQLANNTDINAFRFYGESSTSNLATISLDNIKWYSSCTIPPFSWNGNISSDPTNTNNWSPAAVPASTASVVIPAGLTNYPSFTNNTTTNFGSITIDAGASLTLQSGAKLTLTGALTNNGALTLENGATFIQGTSLAGSGTYNVKQTVTGAGGAGSAPTGRFWYMGVPLNNLTRGAAFGSAGTDNRLWSWTESGQPQWSSTITDNNAPLVPTTGYVFRTSAPSTTLNFSGTSLYSIDASIPNLSNSGGSFAGCHLMSNPYTAYLDWEQIFTASTNISSTYCIPTSNGSSMVYDTYNAAGNIAVNPSNVAMTSFIAPMQAFWVVVNPSTQGTLNMTKAMLSHQAGAVGLKDITSFPAFARLNLVSGDFYDQVVIYTDANATSEVEDYDSKKFFLPNKAQVYCPVGNDKLVINALKKGKAQTSAPLTVELPSTQIFTFEMSESFVENGLVVLEDKQEKIFQDMGVNPIYEFFGNTGVIADRFVLHFQLPNGTNNEGQAGIEDLTSGQIAVIANHDGAVTVALSADLITTGDIQIFDGAGRLVAQKAISSAQTSLQLDNRTGVYFVRVQTPMKTETKKVMVY